MSIIDAFDPNIGRIQADAANASPAFEYKPGLLENAVSATASGLATGVTKTAQVVNSTLGYFNEVGTENLRQERIARGLDPEPFWGGKAAKLNSLDESVAAGEKQRETLNQVDQFLTGQTKYLRPDPRTTGAASQILFGLSDIIPRATVGTVLGGPLTGAAAVGLPEGVSSYKVGVSDGLDKKTAAFKGLIEGTTAGAGVLLPGSGLTKGLVSDVALTIGANVGLGVVQRGAVNKLLSDRGYSEMAKQYDAWDKTALITDAILGAAFWGLSRGGEVRSEFSKKPEQPLVDAALTAENARHMQVESAIGVPADPRSLEIHSRQMESAIESLSRGEPVRVDPRLADAEFIRAKNIPESEVVKQMRIDYPEIKAMDSNQHSVDGIPYRAVDGVADSVPYEAATVPDGGIDKAASNGVIDRPSDISVSNNKNGDYLQADSPSGKVSGTVRDGELHINFAEVLPNRRGQGEGKKLYKALIDEALSKGLRVFSDSTVEKSAARVYHSLEQSGYVVKNMIAGTLDDGAVYGRGADSPAFEIVSGPNQNKSPSKSNTANKSGDFMAGNTKVEAARQAVTRYPDMQIHVDDGNGNVIKVSAAEHLRQLSEGDMATAQKESSAFEAAVNCFLGSSL